MSVRSGRLVQRGLESNGRESGGGGIAVPTPRKEKTLRAIARYFSRCKGCGGAVLRGQWIFKYQGIWVCDVCWESVPSEERREVMAEDRERVAAFRSGAE